MLARARIEVPGEDARVLVEVVNDGLFHFDPVVDKGQAFVLALAADDGNAAQSVEIRPDDFTIAVQLQIYLGPLFQDEFCVECNGGVGTGPLGYGVKDTVRMLLCIGSDTVLAIAWLWGGRRRTYLKSTCSTEVSMFLTHSVSSLLLAVLSWKTITDGIFHHVLKVSASAVEIFLTEKSLKRCHWL